MNLDELLANLEEPIPVRPTRRMTQAELESYLDTAANILRGSADHSEFGDVDRRTVAQHGEQG